MRRILFFILISIALLPQVFGAEIPFTDVKKTDIYYDAVKALYTSNVLPDTADHLFRPNELMQRDFYVSLAVGVGCKKCITPSTEDIIKYQTSPFTDLPKTNPYYYCIAYAEDNSITQWYPLDTTGKAYCENKIGYSSTPFCAGNTISRIEAAAILLRRAKLWDDTLNIGSFPRDKNIPDASYYWYGYAKKAIEVWMITQKNDSTIWQNEKITRGEFAIMASKILGYTQCKLDEKNSIESDIKTKSPDGTLSEKNRFPEKSTDVLVPITNSSGAYEYRWKLTNPATWEIRTGNDSTYPVNWLPCGQWVVEVDIIDKTTGKKVSTSTQTIVIECSKNSWSNNLSVSIWADPLVTFIDNPISFTSNVSGGVWSPRYNWDFWDGSISSEQNPNHSYQNPWVYTVTLTVTDENGNTAQSRIVVRITWDKDSDKDGVFDTDDICPAVYGEVNNKWCPKVETFSYELPSSIGKNSCLLGKNDSVWLIIWNPVCTTCPCENKVSILTPLRSCDIVFPTILSKDLQWVYARWGFYMIP